MLFYLAGWRIRSHMQITVIVNAGTRVVARSTSPRREGRRDHGKRLDIRPRCRGTVAADRDRPRSLKTTRPGTQPTVAESLPPGT